MFAYELFREEFKDPSKPGHFKFSGCEFMKQVRIWHKETLPLPERNKVHLLSCDDRTASGSMVVMFEPYDYSTEATFFVIIPQYDHSIVISKSITEIMEEITKLSDIVYRHLMAKSDEE